MKRQFRRSEYQHALNLARKARRRGDAASAERWIRQADRYLAIDDRLQASIEKAKGRRDNLAAKRSHANEDRDLKQRERYLRELENELDQIAAMTDEEYEEFEKKEDRSFRPRT